LQVFGLVLTTSDQVPSFAALVKALTTSDQVPSFAALVKALTTSDQVPSFAALVKAPCLKHSCVCYIPFVTYCLL